MKHPSHCVPHSFGRTGRRIVTGLVMTATAAVLGLAPAFAQSPLQPTGPPWPVAPEFKKDAKARKAISGAACAPTWTCASKQPKVSGRKLATIVERHASSKIQCVIHSSGQIPLPL
jgi:hypothetical protein